MSRPASWVPVRFANRDLYVERDLLNGVIQDGALAPPEHIEDGELNTMCGEDSFAHACADGIVRRYNVPIGTLDELRKAAGWPTAKVEDSDV